MKSIRLQVRDAYKNDWCEGNKEIIIVIWVISTNNNFITASSAQKLNILLPEVQENVFTYVEFITFWFKIFCQKKRQHEFWCLVIFDEWAGRLANNKNKG